MYIHFVSFCFILPLHTASAITLYVCSGVGGCLCPISSSIILMYTASHAMMYSDASLASVDDVITCLIMWAMLRTASLFCVIVALLDINK